MFSIFEQLLIHARIQEFLSGLRGGGGGVQAQLTEKPLTTFQSFYTCFVILTISMCSI